MEKLNNILCEVFRLKGNELDDKLTMDDIMNMKDISTIRTIVKRFV